MADTTQQNMGRRAGAACQGTYCRRRVDAVGDLLCAVCSGRRTWRTHPPKPIGRPKGSGVQPLDISRAEIERRYQQALAEIQHRRRMGGAE